MSRLPKLGLAAAIAATVASAHTLPRQASIPYAIDVHSHFVPDWYRSMVPFTGGNPTPQWNVSSHLNIMQQQGVGRSILSASTPGANVQYGNATFAADIAGRLNEYAANLTRSYPDKFSFFATLPLPFVNESLLEIQHATSLGAIGFALLSNHDGVYLGNTTLTPIFQAINALNMTVFVHPNTPYLMSTCSCSGTTSRIEANFVTALPVAQIEFYAETARTFTSLLLSGVPQNYSNIKWILPHTGGDFPAIWDRTVTYLVGNKGQPASFVNQTYDIMRSRFYYDSAGATYPHQVAGIRGYDVPWSQFLLGSDYPYGVPSAVVQSTNNVRKYAGFADVDRDNVLYNNAAKLLNIH